MRGQCSQLLDRHRGHGRLAMTVHTIALPFLPGAYR